MKTTKIAIPCNAPGGLMSDRCDHFGHCDSFTLVVIADGRIAGVKVIGNVAHDAGRCMQPIELLKENKVDTVIVSGMGSRPLKKFAEEGINVYFAPRHYSEEVYSVVMGFIGNNFSDMKKIHTCQLPGKFHIIKENSNEP